MHPTKLSKRHWLLILTLTLLTFVLGTSEFVIVGILTDISSNLHITNAKAGTLISAFAITFAIATPLVMSATSHLRKCMLFLIGFFYRPECFVRNFNELYHACCFAYASDK